MTMCGYRCDLCKAFAGNIKKNDQRQKLSEMWKKYYDLDIPAKNIYCDGCRYEKTDAKRLDTNCAVRLCVIEKGLKHCGDCPKYPCEIFETREGLSCKTAQEQAGSEFNLDDFNEYLLAFDNRTRFNDYIKEKNQGEQKKNGGSKE